MRETWYLGGVQAGKAASPFDVPSIKSAAAMHATSSGLQSEVTRLAQALREAQDQVEWQCVQQQAGFLEARDALSRRLGHLTAAISSQAACPASIIDELSAAEAQARHLNTLCMVRGVRTRRASFKSKNMCTTACAVKPPLLLNP